MSSKSRLKSFLVIIMLLVIFIEFYSITTNSKPLIDNDSKDYYTQNSFHDTGSKNFVTAIYLDYRLFDSLFEAAILLITVSGITFISKKYTDQE